MHVNQPLDKQPPPVNLRRYDATNTVHLRQPDFAKPAHLLRPEFREKLLARLTFLYGAEQAGKHLPELERVIQIYYAYKPEAMFAREQDFNPEERFTEEDVILITYGDLIHDHTDSPLVTLSKFCGSYLKRTINTLHILPFFPYSSDKGFSVIDFETVDPHLGTWLDIEDLESRYCLMFDGVVNHVSAHSRWFQEFLKGNPFYNNFFIAFDSPDELRSEDRAKIFRPRTSDILTKFDTLLGPKWVWTTFSGDQVDLNYRNPNVLIRVIEVLLIYVRHGADIIRLDAVTYLWSEVGTSCVHLPQTHEIVRLLRDVLDEVAPTVSLITETNVPHRENISYFGNGYDEAHMVYNFALPPLVLHTMYTQNATALTTWAAGLEKTSNQTSLFNFLDSHDGIGLMAVQEILTPAEIDFIVTKATEHGGLISYKSGPDGRDVPYEVNITWFSALNKENYGEDEAFMVKRFVASRVISLVLQGVPGIYLHSLIGSQNDIEAVLKTESKRAINRTVIDFEAIQKALEDPFSKISRINRELGRLIAIRTQKRAFHPNGPQHLLHVSTAVFAVLRISPEGDQRLLTLVNVTPHQQKVEIPMDDLLEGLETWHDLVSGLDVMVSDSKLALSLMPYDVAWLEQTDKYPK
jgi:sucrose phosphorylase